MKPVWKWVIGIVVILFIAALVVGGFFLASHYMSLRQVAVQTRSGTQAQPFGPRGFNNRGDGFPGGGMMPYGMRGYGMHGFGMMGFMPFGGIFSGLFCLAFVVLVVLGIVWLVRRLSAPNPAVIAPAAPVAPVMTHSCQNCGKPVQDDWKNCPYCGKKLKF